MAGIPALWFGRSSHKERYQLPASPASNPKTGFAIGSGNCAGVDIGNATAPLEAGDRKAATTMASGIW
jgi:hypothetical protein